MNNKDLLLIFLVFFIIILLIVRCKKNKENYTDQKTVLSSDELNEMLRSQQSSYHNLYDDSTNYIQLSTLAKMDKLNRFPLTNFDLNEEISNVNTKTNVKNHALLKNFCEKQPEIN